MNVDQLAPKGNHGTHYRYNAFSCRCVHCIEAHRREVKRRRDGIPSSRPSGYHNPSDPPPQFTAPTYVLLNFPVAIVARQAWPDDETAIAAAFGESQ